MGLIDDADKALTIIERLPDIFTALVIEPVTKVVQYAIKFKNDRFISKLRGILKDEVRLENLGAFGPTDNQVALMFQMGKSAKDVADSIFFSYEFQQKLEAWAKANLQHEASARVIGYCEALRVCGMVPDCSELFKTISSFYRATLKLRTRTASSNMTVALSPQILVPKGRSLKKIIAHNLMADHVELTCELEGNERPVMYRVFRNEIHVFSDGELVPSAGDDVSKCILLSRFLVQEKDSSDKLGPLVSMAYYNNMIGAYGDATKFQESVREASRTLRLIEKVRSELEIEISNINVAFQETKWWLSTKERRDKVQGNTDRGVFDEQTISHRCARKMSELRQFNISNDENIWADAPHRDVLELFDKTSENLLDSLAKLIAKQGSVREHRGSTTLASAIVLGRFAGAAAMLKSQGKLATHKYGIYAADDERAVYVAHSKQLFLHSPGDISGKFDGVFNQRPMYEPELELTQILDYYSALSWVKCKDDVMRESEEAIAEMVGAAKDDIVTFLNGVPDRVRLIRKMNSSDRIRASEIRDVCLSIIRKADGKACDTIETLFRMVLLQYIREGYTVDPDSQHKCFYKTVMLGLGISVDPRKIIMMDITVGSKGMLWTNDGNRKIFRIAQDFIGVATEPDPLGVCHVDLEKKVVDNQLTTYHELEMGSVADQAVSG